MLVIPGALILVLVLLNKILPPPFSSINIEGMSVAEAMARESTRAAWLLVLGWGLLSFSRWSWYAYVAWTAWTLFGLSQTMLAGEAVITLQEYSILVPLGLPYLWFKRRRFGVGSRVAASAAEA